MWNFSPRQSDDEDSRAEMDAHLDLLTERYVRQGMTPDKARLAARRQFGNLTWHREEVHVMARRWGLDTLRQDFRTAVRQLRRAPGFTAVVVATLGLGIGTTTAVFSVFNTVLLRPLDLADADQLVMLMNVTPEGSNSGASPAKFGHWRRQTPVVTETSAFRSGSVTYTGGPPEQLRQLQVSEAFFTLFRAPVVLGRTFSSDEDRPQGPRVAVLSRSLWQRLYASDPSVTARTISLGGVSHTIVGVLGDFSFREFGVEPEVFVPFQLDPLSTDQGHYFRVAGRLPPGVTLEQAQVHLDGSSADFRSRIPQFPAEHTFGAARVRELLVRDVRPALFVFLGAVSFVLLIACANVASLLLARATNRTAEIAVRSAIGGTRGRILQQLLTESLLLSALGGGLGVVLGLAGVNAVLTVDTAGLPRLGDGALVAFDWRLAAFAVIVSVLTGVCFGLIPAIQGSRTDLAAAFREGAGRAGTGRHTVGRSVLVVAQVGLAVVLLIGAALLIRTAVALGNVDPGFDATNVLTMRTPLALPQYATAASAAQVVRTGVERVRTLADVEHAATSCCLPLQGGYGLPFVISGRPLEGPSHGDGGWISVSPGYFEVFRIPVRRGRAFSESDHGTGEPVVVINETMARQYWPDDDPLNARILIGRDIMEEFDAEPLRRVVGVVGDSRDGGLNADPGPQMFVPSAQVPDAAHALSVGLAPLAWTVRLRSTPTPRQIAAIQETLASATGLPVTGVRPMEEIVSRSLSRQRFNMWLMSLFGAAALVLAAVGVYGLMAFSVSQRQQEIGIRRALGADASQVRRMVVFQGMRLVVIGVVAGLVASAGLARVLEAQLFAVSPHDAVVFITVPALLTAVALLAVWIPAGRASKVDPLTALRQG